MEGGGKGKEDPKVESTLSSLFGTLKENKSFLLNIRRKTNLLWAPRCMATSLRTRMSCERSPLRHPLLLQQADV